EIFEHVVAQLGLEPDRVLFLDDNIINVEGARVAGLQSERVRGIAEARAAISKILQPDRRGQPKWSLKGG
ncbi:MAG TPA: hypothetical protein VHW74_17335, partial [Mycobacteriales bacterium]|nr:hypothetical protein [Mycobacteriales bacterium]